MSKADDIKIMIENGTDFETIMENSGCKRAYIKAQYTKLGLSWEDYSSKKVNKEVESVEVKDEPEIIENFEVDHVALVESEENPMVVVPDAAELELPEDKSCTGRNCTTTTGYDHSPECIEDYDKATKLEPVFEEDKPEPTSNGEPPFTAPISTVNRDYDLESMKDEMTSDHKINIADICQILIELEDKPVAWKCRTNLFRSFLKRMLKATDFSFETKRKLQRFSLTINPRPTHLNMFKEITQLKELVEKI